MKNSSLAEKAYITIKKDILTCAFDPGSQVAQSQLVQRYDFGVTPIREALKRLEHDGYLRSIPRYGYVISPITIKDVEDLYEIRLMLEISSVQLAVKRATNEQLGEIKTSANFTYTHKNRESYLHFLEHNISFHVLIAQASGNRKLAGMLNSVLNEMTRIFNLGLDLRDSAEEMRHEHVALSNALATRDVDQAVKIISDQITVSRQRVLEELMQRLNQQNIGTYDFNLT
jgi:DNA-binding GntR family transcriptional regulator